MQQPHNNRKGLPSGARYSGSQPPTTNSAALASSTPSYSPQYAHAPAFPISANPTRQSFAQAPRRYVGASNVPYRPSGPSPLQASQSSPYSYGQAYPFMPGVQMNYDWDNVIVYTGIAGSYEPLGELAQEGQQGAQAQEFRGNDFNIPYPVATTELPQPSSSVGTPASQQHQSPAHTPLHPPPRHDLIHTGMKRKADSTEPHSATSSVATAFPSDVPPPSKLSKSRAVSQSANAGPSRQSEARSPTSRRRTAEHAGSPEEEDDVTGEGDEDLESRRPSNNSVGTSKERIGSQSKTRRIVETSSSLTGTLPAGKVFPIQIGSELFRLSGASISSDAPSYFTHFFGEQLNGGPSRAGELKTLYIDRDPGIFRDIALHLQGYYVRPRDSEHFVKLFADAQFYSLPRLTQQLFKSEIFVNIGGQDFRIPRDLFSSPGDSPNFFSLGFAHFFSTPSEAFPGLDRTTLLRPPSILPPTVHGRSGKTFSELMRLLQGYPVHIENEDHRAELLRDARYFHLKGLEQKLIPCEISFNLLRDASEILMRLEDLRQSGVSFSPDTNRDVSTSGQTSTSPGESGPKLGPGFVSYARPYVDEETHTLILEIAGSESARLHFAAGPTPTSVFVRAAFVNQTLARVSSLFQVIANKMGLPATQPLGLMMMESGGGVAAQPVSPANSGVSEDKVKIRIDADAYVELDGRSVFVDSESEVSRSWASPRLMRPKNRRSSIHSLEEDEEEMEEVLDLEEEEDATWMIRRAHWRLRVVPGEETGRMEVVMVAVRIEAFTTERIRNGVRGFLG